MEDGKNVLKHNFTSETPYFVVSTLFKLMFLQILFKLGDQISNVRE